MTAAIDPASVASTWSGALLPPESIPSSADVVIIGGGIIGISTAWFLAQQGVRAVVCEKGHVAGEQSGRNWGWVRVQGRDTREMPMIVESLNIWRGLESAIGEDVGFRQGGILYSADDDAHIAQYNDWIESVSEYGVDSRMIDGAELSALVQGAAKRWRAALYTPSDGRAEPQKAAPAIARAAERAGAKILTSCAVRGIETQAGRVAAVVTEHGRIDTSIVLCAAGAWTNLFCRSLDIDVPQLKVRGTVVRTAPAKKVLDGSLFTDALAVRRRLDGGYTLANGLVIDYPLTPATFRYAPKFMRAFLSDRDSVRLSLGAEFVEEWRTPKTWPLDSVSPFEQKRVLDPAPNPRILASIRRHFDALFPELAGTPFIESWAGMIETTPDIIPVIDETEIPGFHVATGFSGHGFGIGPGAGKAIAGMLTGTPTGIDLHEFRLSRFFDGTPIRPQSSV